MTEEQPPKADAESPFKLPEDLGFKAGDVVRTKENPEAHWSILGFTRGSVTLINTKETLRVTPEELKEHFEHVFKKPSKKDA